MTLYLFIFIFILAGGSTTQSVYPNANLNLLPNVPPYDHIKTNPVMAYFFGNQLHFNDETLTLEGNLYTVLTYHGDYCDQGLSDYDCFKDHPSLDFRSYHLYGVFLGSYLWRMNQTYVSVQKHELRLPCFLKPNKRSRRYYCYDNFFFPVPLLMRCEPKSCLQIPRMTKMKYYKITNFTIRPMVHGFYEMIGSRAFKNEFWIEYEPKIDFDTVVLFPMVTLVLMTVLQYSLPITSKHRLIFLKITLTLIIMSLCQLRFDFLMWPRLGANCVKLLRAMVCLNTVSLVWTVLANFLLNRYTENRILEAKSSGQTDLLTKIDETSLLSRFDFFLVERLGRFCLLPPRKSSSTSVALVARSLLLLDRFVGLSILIATVVVVSIYNKLYL